MFTVELWLFRCSIQVNEYSDLMCEFEKPFLINLQGGLSCLPLLCGFYARANAFSGVTNGSISRTLIGYAECFTSQQLGEWAVKHIWFNFVSSSEHCEAWRKGWGWEKSRERARNGEGGLWQQRPGLKAQSRGCSFYGPWLQTREKAVVKQYVREGGSDPFRSYCTYRWKSFAVFPFYCMLCSAFFFYPILTVPFRTNSL